MANALQPPPGTRAGTVAPSVRPFVGSHEEKRLPARTQTLFSALAYSRPGHLEAFVVPDIARVVSSAVAGVARGNQVAKRVVRRISVEVVNPKRRSLVATSSIVADLSSAPMTGKGSSAVLTQEQNPVKRLRTPSFSDVAVPADSLFGWLATGCPIAAGRTKFDGWPPRRVRV
jgi:hypothetical protein